MEIEPHSTPSSGGIRPPCAGSCINLALNHLRGTPAEHTPIGDVASFPTSLQTSQLVAAEVWRKVSARLDELPPKQRLALELRIFHDLSFEEVAVVAGFSVESAKANFHHAVKRLRGLLPTPR
jgi:RNA polymerase sigma-70 factor, ECF subfamily